MTGARPPGLGGRPIRWGTTVSASTLGIPFLIDDLSPRVCQKSGRAGRWHFSSGLDHSPDIIGGTRIMAKPTNTTSLSKAARRCCERDHRRALNLKERQLLAHFVEHADMLDIVAAGGVHEPPCRDKI